MTTPARAKPARLSARAAWGGAVLIVVAAVAAYQNSLGGPFVFDDASSIETNPTIRRLWPLSDVLAGPTSNVTAQGRPVLNLSLAINYAISGTTVAGYHVTNLIIHTLAALTLFGLVRRTVIASDVAWKPIGKRDGTSEFTPRSNLSGTPPDRILHATWFAASVAVLWLIHPLQTESVTYIIQRAESLVGLFYLLTLYAVVRLVEAGGSVDRRRIRSVMWSALAVIACLAGMATKEVMATAPLMLLFFDRTFFAGTFREALRRRRFLYLSLAGTWVLLAVLVARTGFNRGGSVGFGVGVAWWEYALTQFKAIAHYVGLAVWPHPLVFEYGSFWIRSWDEIALPLLIVAGLLAATLVGLWRGVAIGFLGAWFFGVLAPTSLAPGTTQMIVEHRMYLPLAAVVIGIVAGVHACLAHRRPMLLAAMLLASLALILQTRRRNADYQTDVGLWADTVAKRPENPLAHFMLGGALERVGRLTEASTHYERSLALKPDFSIGHQHLGELRLRAGRRGEAILHFETALRLQPEYPDAHMNLGTALLEEGRTADALRHLQRATELMPASAVIHARLGYALAATGNPEPAVAEYLRALALEPGLAEVHFNLANALVELRRPAEAVPHYEAAIQGRPHYAAAHYNLANLHATAGRLAEAVRHYQAALEVRPDYVEAHHNLGSAFFQLGHLDAAARHYTETLRLQPGFPNARENLERVQARMKASDR